MDDVLARVKRRLADEPAQPDPARIAAIIREEAVVISDIGVLDIMRKLRDDTTGAGPLEAILADPGRDRHLRQRPRRGVRGHGPGAAALEPDV